MSEFVDREIEVIDVYPRDIRAAIVKAFLRSIPSLMGELERAFAANDADAVFHVAHKIKGSCLSREGRMRALCSDIEVNAKTEKRLSKDALADLRETSDAILEELRRRNPDLL